MKKLFLAALLGCTLFSCTTPERECATELVNVKFDNEDNQVKIYGAWHQNRNVETGQILEDVGILPEYQKLTIISKHRINSVTIRGISYDYKLYRLTDKAWVLESAYLPTYFYHNDILDLDLLIEK